MNTDYLMQSTANMFEWLNTWRQENGAYNGWVVHRFDLKRLKYIHDTPWEQTPIIDGLFNLYKATGNIKYYIMAKESVILQISRLDEGTGMFDNAGFEDDRFSSLVHNSLADCALLTFAENCNTDDEALKQKALNAVKINLDKYFMGVLYCKDAQAFKFSAVDYYWPQANRFVANMNSVAIEVMMRYFKISGQEFYRNLALQVLKSVTDLVCTQKDSIQEGAIGYANTHPDWYISIYTALALRGICEVYKYNKDKELEKIMISSVSHLLKYTDNGYFCHAIQDGKRMPYPYWIAGGGMILKAVDDVEKLTGVHFDIDKQVETILKHQQKCGGVSSFKKYNSTDNHRRKNKPEVSVWEDIVPGPPWNAHLFEYLTRFANRNFDSFVPHNSTSFVIKPRYIYYENKKTFFVFSVVPLYSCAFVLIKKSKDTSIIAFSLRSLYARIIRKIKHKTN